MGANTASGVPILSGPAARRRRLSNRCLFYPVLSFNCVSPLLMALLLMKHSPPPPPPEKDTYTHTHTHTHTILARTAANHPDVSKSPGPLLSMIHPRGMHFLKRSQSGLIRLYRLACCKYSLNSRIQPHGSGGDNSRGGNLTACLTCLAASATLMQANESLRVWQLIAGLRPL